MEQKPKSYVNQGLLLCCKFVNVDLVNDNVYTKFSLNLFIYSQDMEKKTNSDVNQGPYLC